MRNKLSVYLVLAALLVLGTGTVERAHSQQKDAGVAAGGRVARGKNDRSRARATRSLPRDSASPGEDASITRAAEIESLEQQCLDEVNRIRRNRGLAPLEFYEELLPVARGYSRRMAEEHFFSHDDPDGRTVRERLDDANIKWRVVGENLAYSNGYISPVVASLHGWMESPGHRKNLLDPDYRLTAIGAWISPDGTVYFTEIFLRQ